MKRVFLTCFLSLVLAAPSFAAMRGQATMTWLGIAASAREEAMGGIASLGDADASCAFTNQAGLGRIERGSVFFNHTGWLADMTIMDFSAAYNVTGIGTFALSFRSLDYGDITFTRVAINPYGYELVDDGGDVGGMMVGLAFGRKLTDKFSVGGQFKYASEKLGSMSTIDAITGTVTEDDQADQSAVLFDFGSSYETGWKGVIVSMTIQNFGSSQKASNGVEEFTPPLTFKIGLEADVFAFANAQNDLSEFIVRVEGVDPRDDREAINFGGEFRITPSESAFLALRGGWARRDAGGVSFGAGLGLNAGGVGVVVDYSYSDYGDILGAVNRIGLSIGF